MFFHGMMKLKMMHFFVFIKPFICLLFFMVKWFHFFLSEIIFQNLSIILYRWLCHDFHLRFFTIRDTDFRTDRGASRGWKMQLCSVCPFLWICNGEIWGILTPALFIPVSYSASHWGFSKSALTVAQCGDLLGFRTFQGLKMEKYWG